MKKRTQSHTILIKKRTVMIGMLAGVLFLSMMGYIIANTDTQDAWIIETTIQNEGTTNPTREHENTVTQEPIETIFVYMIGGVSRPGIYELEKGSMLIDAVHAAGGFHPDANENIDLVWRIFENITIRIPMKDEKSEDHPRGVDIIEDRGIAHFDEPDAKVGPIDINRATKEQLATLPGIGPVTATSIIDYRMEHGPFRSIEEIMKVTGIKQQRFEQIKAFIVVR